MKIIEKYLILLLLLLDMMIFIIITMIQILMLRKISPKKKIDGSKHF